MKKYINGKSYDTATATELGCFSNGGTWRDFNHFVETLYRKRTGEYFLHGEGGPMTQYRERVDNSSWSGGEQIIPITVDEAREWAEKNLGTEEYDAIFGAIAEDDSTTTLSLSMSAATADKARRAAAAAGLSLSAYIANLIENN